MKTPESPPPSPPRQRTPSGSKGVALCAIGAMTVSCAAIPLRPVAKDCPPAAIRAMRERGLKIPGPGVAVKLDINGPKHDWAKLDQVRFAAGQDVVSQVIEGGYAGFVEGTVLFGKVVAGGDGLFFIRYEAAQFADTPQRVPICAEVTDFDSVGTPNALEMGPRSTNDTFTHINRAYTEFVLYFRGDL